MSSFAYIGLGSNLGQRESNLRQALAALGAHPEITHLRTARFIKTDPLGPKPQGKYLNTACSITTSLSPQELLETCHAIEGQLGRNRQAETMRWGPRVIDLDILLYDNLVLHEPDLIIPHPHMHERAFVLIPLSEIAGHIIDPRSGKSIARLATELNYLKSAIT